jgi:hypothetical protein
MWLQLTKDETGKKQEPGMWLQLTKDETAKKQEPGMWLHCQVLVSYLFHL